MKTICKNIAFAQDGKCLIGADCICEANERWTAEDTEQPSPTIEPVIRWVRAADRFPQAEPEDKLVSIKPIREGFDFYMFLKYVQDTDKEGPPSFKWNLWDGHHGWTRKISPEMLLKIEWLEDFSNQNI